MEITLSLRFLGERRIIYSPQKRIIGLYVYYEDRYMEEIICRDNDTMAKRLSYENSYALGDENKVYAYCYDLFFDEVNPAFPDK